MATKPTTAKTMAGKGLTIAIDHATPMAIEASNTAMATTLVRGGVRPLSGTIEVI